MSKPAETQYSARLARRRQLRAALLEEARNHNGSSLIRDYLDCHGQGSDDKADCQFYAAGKLAQQYASPEQMLAAIRKATASLPGGDAAALHYDPVSSYLLVRLAPLAQRQIPALLAQLQVSQ